MPLLRQSLYSQNVNIYLAPTADARDTWLALMRTVGFEGRAFVVSANQCVKENELPGWITGDDSKGMDGVDGVTGGSSPGLSTKGRKLSITAEGPHEIVWPDKHTPQSQSQPPSHIGMPPIFIMPLTHLTSNAVPKPSQSRSTEFVSRGGSCIISPYGEVLAGPIWEVCTEDSPDAVEPGAQATGDGLIVSEVDIEDCHRGRLDLDVAGSYSRNDAFKLNVEGLELDPPPL